MGAARSCCRSRRAVPSRGLSGGGAAVCALCTRVVTNGLIRAVLGGPYSVLERSIPPDLIRRWTPVGVKKTRQNTKLVQSRRAELVLDALKMIETLDLAVELGAFFFRKLGLHFRDRVGELGAIELVERSGDVGKHGEASG